MKLDKLSKFAPIFLRWGISLVFLWFGFTQLFDPESWIGFLPSWTSLLPISATTFIYLNGVFEVIFGILLVLGLFTRIVALLLGLHMLGIVFSLGYNPTAVRDLGIAFATVAIALQGPDQGSLDETLSWRRV